MHPIQSSKMLIGGKYVSSISAKTYIIRNPATQEPVAEVPIGGRADAIAALEAADLAFPGWSHITSQRRGDILHKAASIVRERIDPIARLLTVEQGKPLKDSRREVFAAADVLDYYAEEGKRCFGEWITPSSGRGKSIVFRQPIGVAALIIPWNLPVDLLAWKLGPALAAGCTVVAKPPSRAPLAAAALMNAVHYAGAPPGSINSVFGSGGEVGAELVENPISKKIAFTGETATGRWIMQRAASCLKRVSLELGGSCPAIVCSDAQLEAAVEACVKRAFSNMGQICISINRLYVAKDIVAEFTDMFVEQTAKLRVGNGLKEDVDLGPMFSEDQRQKTIEHVVDAKEKGAKILFGGQIPGGEELSRGFFYMPTVLSSVNHTMKVMREETFGPVAPIMPFSTLKEAIELANDTQYGLAAYVFTNDLGTALTAAERLEAGGVGININNVVEIQAPFGGWKQSGFGRELSHHGLDEYMEIKHVRLGL